MTGDYAAKLALARRKGAAARDAGQPIPKNPYSNKGGGRPYYRAWRAGWLGRLHDEVNDEIAKEQARAEGKGGWL
jgi:hypothetical protein